MPKLHVGGSTLRLTEPDAAFSALLSAVEAYDA